MQHRVQGMERDLRIYTTHPNVLGQYTCRLPLGFCHKVSPLKLDTIQAEKLFHL